MYTSQDPIHIISVDLGSSAPRISNARVENLDSMNTLNSKLSSPSVCAWSYTLFDDAESVLPQHASFHMTYTDTVSVSLATSVLFHYPLPYFIRLPVRLNISLSLFAASVSPFLLR